VRSGWGTSELCFMKAHQVLHCTLPAINSAYNYGRSPVVSVIRNHSQHRPAHKLSSCTQSSPDAVDGGQLQRPAVPALQDGAQLVGQALLVLVRQVGDARGCDVLVHAGAGGGLLDLVALALSVVPAA
jgi:hypothetical protein